MGVTSFVAYKKSRAIRLGTEVAAQSVLLPQHQKVLRYAPLIQLMHVVSMIIRNVAARELFICLFLTTQVLINGCLASAIVLLLKRGSGLQAIRSSIRIGFLLGLGPGMVLAIYVLAGNNQALLWLAFVANTVFLAMLLVLWLLPKEYLPCLLKNRRESLKHLLCYLSLFLSVTWLVSFEIVIDRSSKFNSACVYVVNDIVFSASKFHACSLPLRCPFRCPFRCPDDLQLTDDAPPLFFSPLRRKPGPSGSTCASKRRAITGAGCRRRNFSSPGSWVETPRRCTRSTTPRRRKPPPPSVSRPCGAP